MQFSPETNKDEASEAEMERVSEFECVCGGGSKRGQRGHKEEEQEAQGDAIALEQDSKGAVHVRRHHF